MILKYAHNKESNWEEISQLLLDIQPTLNIEEVNVLNIRSPKHKEKMAGRGILSRYAGTAPFILVEGTTTVRGVYNEVVDFDDLVKLKDKISKEVSRVNMIDEISDNETSNKDCES